MLKEIKGNYRGLQWIAGFPVYRGLYGITEVTVDNRGLKEITGEYREYMWLKGLQGITGDYMG